MTADKTPATEPADAATNAAPAAAVEAVDTDTNANANVVPPPGAITETGAGAGDTNAVPDLSSMTREQLEARVKTLTDSLAASNAEAENFREQWTELKLRDEALGVEALTVDEAKTQDKLVEAVKELYQSEMRRREALVLINKLLVSSDGMLATAPKYDPKLRAQYEEATRSAKAYLAGRSGSSVPLADSLSNGQIADVNQELDAVILNLGKNQGVKEGMLFLIYQNNVSVGQAKVVLARDLISAAQVESLKPNTVLKIGDRVAVETGP